MKANPYSDTTWWTSPPGRPGGLAAFGVVDERPVG
jgi:hypothetical protein